MTRLRKSTGKGEDSPHSIYLKLFFARQKSSLTLLSDLSSRGRGSTAWASHSHRNGRQQNIHFRKAFTRSLRRENPFEMALKTLNGSMRGGKVSDHLLRSAVTEYNRTDAIYTCVESIEGIIACTSEHDSHTEDGVLRAAAEDLAAAVSDEQGWIIP